MKLTKRFTHPMYYGDVAMVAEAAGIHMFDLWWPIKKYFDPFDRGNTPFTTSGLLLRYLCQNFDMEIVNKALGRA